MKKLPIGIQEFSKLRNEQFVYVDKTRQIYNLLQRHQYFFLSRPRRFGKSLLLNTIKEIFLGNKKLFEGLWIYDKINWEPLPVIKISFANIDYNSLGLEKAIDTMLLGIADAQNIRLTAPTYSLKWDELIKRAANGKKVVVLIDEYDKPIIDYLDDLPTAEKNRDILKNFYSVIKDADSFIRFFFVTGVSKFSKVSIFSDLNSLDDITLDDDYATILGWTHNEVENNFGDEIDAIAEKHPNAYANIRSLMKEWYDGYSWDGKSFVYNPVSLMNFLSKKTFNNYWFTTGTPTFLMKIIKSERYSAFDIENKTVSISLLDKYDLNNMTLLPLLFQTGYLTIKNYDRQRNTIVLDYPNREVADSFSMHILSELTIGKLDKTDMLLVDMVRCFDDGDIPAFISHINTLFLNLPYSIIDQKEKYFHSIFYTIMKLVGYKIESEILTIDGRIDAVVKTCDRIYIIEFKINQSANTAIRQIIQKRYAEKYADDPRTKILLGINFDTDTRRADDFEVVDFY